MKSIVVAIAILAASSANAEVFGVVRTHAENIVLSDQRNVCPVDHNLAFRVVNRGGKPMGQGGCYRITPDNRISVRFFIDPPNTPAKLYSFDDFTLSDYYRRMNPLSN